MIQLDETPDADRIDAATLPPFSNNSRCPRCRLKRDGGMLRYRCPWLRADPGAHFHHRRAFGGTREER